MLAYFCSELEEYMSDTVRYVITNENWDDNFEEVWYIYKMNAYNYIISAQA
jgi:hypothetical protein